MAKRISRIEDIEETRLAELERTVGSHNSASHEDARRDMFHVMRVLYDHPIKIHPLADEKPMISSNCTMPFFCMLDLGYHLVLAGIYSIPLTP
jgi:hypothetical protein